jgi:hypothetical protein
MSRLGHPSSTFPLDGSLDSSTSLPFVIVTRPFQIQDSLPSQSPQCPCPILVSQPPAVGSLRTDGDCVHGRELAGAVLGHNLAIHLGAPFIQMLFCTPFTPFLFHVQVFKRICRPTRSLASVPAQYNSTSYAPSALSSTATPGPFSRRLVCMRNSHSLAGMPVSSNDRKPGYESLQLGTRLQQHLE